MKDSGSRGNEPSSAAQHPAQADPIARRLTGALVCIGCGYNLHGLSIRASCPECGLPVRATLLGVVDPRAEEIEPLFAPRAVANGLVLWTVGAMVACLCVWALRADEIVRSLLDVGLGLGFMGFVGFLALCCSFAGSLTMIRPHRSVTRRGAVRAALGAAAYLPVLAIYWVVYRGVDLSSPSPLLDPGDQRIDRSVLRITLALGAAVIIWGLRPNAVMLAMRSVIVRTGRVDRQSLYALLAAFLIAAIGDALHIFGVVSGGVVGDLLTQLHVVFVAIGSVLITIGMINAVIDTVRLRPILKRRGVGLSDVFETNRQRDARHEHHGS